MTLVTFWLLGGLTRLGLTISIGLASAIISQENGIIASFVAKGWRWGGWTLFSAAYLFTAVTIIKNSVQFLTRCTIGRRLINTLVPHANLFLTSAVINFLFLMLAFATGWFFHHGALVTNTFREIKTTTLVCLVLQMVTGGTRRNRDIWANAGFTCVENLTTLSLPLHEFLTVGTIRLH